MQSATRLHLAHAARDHPALKNKSVTLHTLWHTAAMQLLHAGIETTVIAFWLGHERVETTQIYLHAALALKEKALARTRPLDTKPGRYRPPDSLLASSPHPNRPDPPTTQGLLAPGGITGRSA
jgi:integrase/recombinase XerD